MAAAGSRVGQAERDAKARVMVCCHQAPVPGSALQSLLGGASAPPAVTLRAPSKFLQVDAGETRS